MSRLPIHDVFDQLDDALNRANMAVIQAPPGAGKSTALPVHLIQSNRYSGKIILLEPRRLATRATAERIAQLLGEKPGNRVGYRMRGATKTSDHAKIEVVTEGVLTRMIQNDPELAGIDCIIFDEFHERSLHGDLGLALSLEIRGALREDLSIIVMSATLDAAPVAELLGNAPMVTSQGRAFPVEEIFLPRPWADQSRRGPRFEEAVARLVHTALADQSGSILVFLPGAGEIHRVADLLEPALPQDTSLHKLYGAMPFEAQRAAIRAPEENTRKIVLATSIAETSLTIEGIRVVIDAGRARRAAFDAGTGLTRLITERVTRAEATQRMGRAGRLTSGVCYRLWTKGENGGLLAFPAPEILSSDLADLALELAQWGAAPSDLAFLTQPRDKDYNSACDLLRSLGALDHKGAITDHGRKITKLALNARLASMVLKAGKDAPLFAAMCAEYGGPDAPLDLGERWGLVQSGRLPQPIRSRIKDSAASLPKGQRELSLAEMAALAFPDRIAMRRSGEAARYLLANGRGAKFAKPHSLGKEPFLVISDLKDDMREADIRAAISIDRSNIEALFPEQIQEEKTCVWDGQSRQIQARKKRMFGAIALSDQNWTDCPPDAFVSALLDAIQDLGLAILPWNKSAKLFRSRVAFAQERGGDFPDFSDKGLLERVDEWLAPYLDGCRKLSDLDRLDLTSILRSTLDFGASQALETLVPESFVAPTGTKVRIDYAGDVPKISIRIQEMFGTKVHPCVGPDRTPLLVELLSPGHKPIQLTADLVNFWHSSYGDVRKDMRGRYPKHPWPEDPSTAPPTTRRKPKT